MLRDNVHRGWRAGSHEESGSSGNRHTAWVGLLGVHPVRRAPLRPRPRGEPRRTGMSYPLLGEEAPHMRRARSQTRAGQGLAGREPHPRCPTRWIEEFSCGQTQMLRAGGIARSAACQARALIRLPSIRFNGKRWPDNISDLASHILVHIVWPSLVSSLTAKVLSIAHQHLGLLRSDPIRSIPLHSGLQPPRGATKWDVP